MCFHDEAFKHGQNCSNNSDCSTRGTTCLDGVCECIYALRNGEETCNVPGGL
jgi:hypothetical protein